jgi:hypothetical protein
MAERTETITTTPQEILHEDRARNEYSLQNQGSVTIYLGDNNQVSNTGTRKGRELGAGLTEDSSVKQEPETIKKPCWAMVESGTCLLWVRDA